MFWFIVILVGIGFVVYTYIGHLNAQEQSQAMLTSYNNISDFQPTRTIYGFNNGFIFAVDEERMKFLFIDKEGVVFQFYYDELIDCDLIEKCEAV